MKLQQFLQALLVSCAAACTSCMHTPLSHSSLKEEDIGSHEHQQRRDVQCEQLTSVGRRLKQEDGVVATGNSGTVAGVVVFFIVFFGILAFQFRRQIAASCQMCISAAAANAARIEKEQVRLCLSS